MADGPLDRRRKRALDVNCQPRLSIVVPVFNERDNVSRFYQLVHCQLDKLPATTEIVFVDDGSHDESLAVLRALNRSDPRVRIVSLSRNFGHQNAITAGMEYAQGDAVIVMDADLQHPPELIPEMFKHWQDGYQVVYTIRAHSQDTGRLKRWSSLVFYKCINSISEVEIVANAADFRLLDRSVVDCLLGMREHCRFMRGMVSWVGFRQKGIPFVANPRYAGQSKYSLAKMIELALQGFTGFSSRPLRWSAYLGFLVAISVIPYALWAAYAKLLTDTSVPGWASLMVSVLFLGGIQLMSIGIIGEYVGRIYMEVKARPLYVAQEVIGFDEGSIYRIHTGRVGPAAVAELRRALRWPDDHVASLSRRA